MPPWSVVVLTISTERKQNHLAMKVLEKVAGYEVSLKQFKDDIGGNSKEDSERLVAEYYILRTVLASAPMMSSIHVLTLDQAWHQDQLDVAEHMFKKSVTSKQYFDPHTAQSLADTLYEMGKDFFSKKHYDMSVKWLERSYEVLNNQELDKLSMDASELRISIIQTSVKAHLSLKTPEGTARSQSLIELLHSEIGDKLVVLLLKLEMLSSLPTEAFDSNTYHDVLQRMVRTVVLNESNFRLVMFHVRKLNDDSPSLASQVLEEFLRLRLLDQEKNEWLEKVIITRLWIMVKQQENVDALQALDKLLSLLVANVTHPLRSAAAHAAHTVRSF